MTINSLLQEELYKSKKVKLYSKTEKISIFKNPSLKECQDLLKEFSKEFGFKSIIRGVMLENGDLYIIYPFTFIHSQILNVLNRDNDVSVDDNTNWYDNADLLEKFLCVSSKNGKEWIIAESYDFAMITDQIIKRYTKLFSNLSKKLNTNPINKKSISKGPF